MRLSEDKIKEAILHPDPDIRERATRYFAASYRPDPTVMPLVIKAVETHGRDGAYPLIGESWDLAQTEETIAWIIDELNDEKCDENESYAYNLSMVLVKADPALVAPRQPSIIQARHFSRELKAALEERVQMMSWDAATGWQKLEELCEESKDKEYVSEFNMGRAERIVDALARYGPACEQKVHSLLNQKIEDYRHDPMKWLEPLAVRLAGVAQLESTVPLIVAKLREGVDDLLNEECAEALGRIGTSAVLEAVAAAYPSAKDHFRLHAAGMLEHIHSDQTVETCLTLLRQEKDDDIRVFLAQSLLGLFAFEGIEAARRLVLDQPFDFNTRGLRNELIETATIMGVQFPELEEWRAEERGERREHRRVIETFGDSAEGSSRSGLSKLTDPPRLTPFRKPADQPKVGRNDPCPCGSGKKFKNCCMRK